MSEEQLTKKERKEQKRKEREAERLAQENARRDAKKSRITKIVISAVVVVGFLAWLISNAPEPINVADFETNPDEIMEVTEKDWIKGNLEATAPITLVKYSDFQCPGCRAYSGIITQLLSEYPNQVRFVYRHFPLPTHPYAIMASEYAEAAGKQGKFFEMHDLIFASQDEWSYASRGAADKMFREFAESLELDMEQLDIDRKSEETWIKIRLDRQDGDGAGVDSTPTFFLNGEKLDPLPRSYEEFVVAVLGEDAVATPLAPTTPEIQVESTGGTLEIGEIINLQE